MTRVKTISTQPNYTFNNKYYIFLTESCGIYPTPTFSYSKRKLEVNVIKFQNNICILYTLTKNSQFDN